MSEMNFGMYEGQNAHFAAIDLEKEMKQQNASFISIIKKQVKILLPKVSLTEKDWQVIYQLMRKDAKKASKSYDWMKEIEDAHEWAFDFVNKKLQVIPYHDKKNGKEIELSWKQNGNSKYIKSKDNICIEYYPKYKSLSIGYVAL